jgi:hypothetical protein
MEGNKSRNTKEKKNKKVRIEEHTYVWFPEATVLPGIQK